MPPAGTPVTGAWPRSIRPAGRRCTSRCRGRGRAVRGRSRALTSVEVAVVGTNGRQQSDLLAFQQPAVATVTQFVEHAVDVVGAGTLRTPEVVVGGLPGPVAAGTHEPPPVATVLYLDRLLRLRHYRSGLTEGGTKGGIQTRVVEVKVIVSPPRPPNIRYFGGESETGARAVGRATCLLAACIGRGHVFAHESGTPADGGSSASNSFSPLPAPSTAR